MRFLSIVLCLIFGITNPAAAAPDQSLRPVARDMPSLQSLAPAQTRPMARPEILETALASKLATQFRRENDPDYAADPVEFMAARAKAFAALSRQATGLSLRPLTRPGAIVQKAMAQRRERARGAVCNDPDIQGEAVGLVPGRISGCGIQDAVRVRSVSGIALTQQSLMDCTTAKALKRWINNGMKPAVGSYGGGVREIRVAAHYACRTRNNQAGARISEHGKGRAIDISGFRMRDGSDVTLLQGWNRQSTGRILREMHRSAFGIFGTVLGPESNRFHLDHF